MEIKYITSSTVTIPVEKILSENFLYRPSRGKGGHAYLRLDENVRAYKDYLKQECEESGFHDLLSEIKSKFGDSIIIVSYYTFYLPESEFFLQDGRIGRSDVTNMLKAVEDSILGEVIDDRQVVQTLIRKCPTENNRSVISATYYFYYFHNSEIE